MSKRRTLASPKPLLGASAVVGALIAAFGLGRQTAQSEAAPLDPRNAAAQVSEALHLASEDAARSTVQVEAYQRRGSRLRRRQDGSGVVVDVSGRVVTNNHVVEGADAFKIVFTDGESLQATLLGRDPVTDLAVLQLTRKDGKLPRKLDVMGLRTELPPVGELVLAVGNPLSLGHTVTLGVVNGHGRDNLDIAEYENYIQTDAAINPGNSGGPLVDIYGRAVGITVAVGLESNGDGGLAFAIPAAMVAKVVEEIVEHGRVRRAYLGVQTYRPWEAERALAADRARGYTGRSAVKIRSVIEDTPADRAGLKDGDVLIAIGERAMDGSQSFSNALIESSLDEEVPIRVWRAGKDIVRLVRLIER